MKIRMVRKERLSTGTRLSRDFARHMGKEGGRGERSESTLDYFGLASTFLGGIRTFSVFKG